MGSRLPEDYCLWEMEDASFQVGVIGTGPGFSSLLDIICNPQIGEFMPPLTLVAVCETRPDDTALNDPRSRGVPVYGTHQDMLAAHPEINLLVEMAGKRHDLKTIVAGLPAGVSFVDHTASFFLCALDKFAAISARCRVSLDDQRAVLRAIIDEIPENILVLDRNGVVQDCNRNVAVSLGQPKEQVLGLACREAQAIDPGVPFCGPDEVNCPFRAVLSTGRKAESLETRVSAEGRLVYFREYAYPIFDSFGRLAHVLVMRRDITSRTEDEKRAQQSQRMGLLGRLSAYLAHEIRNPLFAIGGFANSLVKSPNLNEREREKLGIILEETARLDRILKEIIGFSRPVEGPVGEVDAAWAVEEAAQSMRPGFLSRGTALNCRMAKGLPMVRGEADTLKQTVIHLLLNALEAMDAPGEVTVGAGLDKGFVTVTVADTGRGMSQEALEQVFSPFATSRHAGHGLGLAMIQKVLEDWGGSIEVASTQGRGTTVTLRLAPVLDAREGIETVPASLKRN